LSMIVALLPMKTFINMMATCQTLRRHGLTVFQPHARAHVLALQWATPLISLGEYDAAAKANPNKIDWLVHFENSPVTGDWMLYLSFVHRTNSMRARQRIWHICEALKKLVEEKYPTSEYAQNLTVERPRLETVIKNLILNAEGMRRLMYYSEQGWEEGPANERVKQELGIPRFPVPI